MPLTPGGNFNCLAHAASLALLLHVGSVAASP